MPRKGAKGRYRGAGLALLGAALVAGCARTTVPTVGPGEGRGTFEFVTPAGPQENKDVKVSVGEPSANEERVAPRPRGKLAEPIYPPAARAAGEGPVVLGMRLVIDTEGKVAEVTPNLRAWATPTRWSAEFRAAVEAAVAQWRFRPAEVRRFTTVKNAEGTYRSMTGSEPTEWVLEVMFSFGEAGGRN